MKLEVKDIQVTKVRGKHQSSWYEHKSEGVQVLHRPTGISVTEFSDRSDHRNMALAYGRLEKIVAMAKPIDWESKLSFIRNREALRLIGTLDDLGIDGGLCAAEVYAAMNNLVLKVVEAVKK